MSPTRRRISARLGVALAGAAIFVACSSPYAEDTPPIPDGPSPEASPDAQSTTDASSAPDQASEAAKPIDGGVDAADAAPPCTLKPIGIGCASSLECCSNGCDEARVCAPSCKKSVGSCNPMDAAPCCVGLYCSGLGICMACIGSGGTAASVLGAPSAKSCCSRALNGATGKCQ